MRLLFTRDIDIKTPQIAIAFLFVSLVIVTFPFYHTFNEPLTEMEVQIPGQSDWVDYGTIFRQGEVGEWDYQLWGGFAGTAVKHNGTYFLYYQGASGYQLLPDETVTWRAIGVATSPDGVNFTKYNANPIINWFPTPDGEEGAASGGATLNGAGGISLFFGANTSVGPTEVHADGRQSISTNGKEFTDNGIVLDHLDNNIWGSGDELFPIIAFEDDGQWVVYYIPNGSGTNRQLGVAWGNAPTNLNNSAGVTSSLTAVRAWGMGGYAKVGPDLYALFINDVTVPKTEVRTVSLNSPDQVSAPIETYQFDEVTQAVVFLDVDADTWFMYYRGLDEYGLKLAPAGPIDTTPPTAPNNVSAAPLSDREMALSWSPATDSDTGIVQYKIFRDGVEIGTVKGWSYTDSGLVEQTDYSYQISAVNFHGVEGPKSSAIVVTTPPDRTPPQVLSVNAGSNPNQIVIVFDEPVEDATIDNVTDYYEVNNLAVLTASLSADLQTVTLTTAVHIEDNYLLTIGGLHDLAVNPNPIHPPDKTNYVFIGSDGLVGAWSFNARLCASATQRPYSIAVDTSNFGNDGILVPAQNGPIAAQGKIGDALIFDGLDDHVTLNGTSVLENVTDTSHTFAAWVYPDSVPPANTANDSAYSILVRAYTGLYYDANQTFRADIQLSDGTHITSSSGVFNPGTWHHVAMTVDDIQKKLHLYVDGQEAGNSPVSYSGTLADNSGASFFIGTSEPLTNRYEYRFKGLIDETRIYNRSLSNSEIVNLFAWTATYPFSISSCVFLPSIQKQ